MLKELIPARIENLEGMLDLIQKESKELGFRNKEISQIRLASEEILVNIIHYAYPQEGVGNVEIICGLSKGKDGICIQIKDRGIPFNPLEKGDPDTGVSVKDRSIGGLGIFLTKKVMDRVDYERIEEQNVLTLYKKF